MHLYRCVSRVQFLILIVSFFYGAFTVAADLASIQKALTAPDTVRATFTQQRHISGVKKPLVSSGNVIVSKSEGVLWMQETPFPMTLLIRKDSIQQKNPGAPVQRITAASHPQIFQFNTLMHHILYAQIDALEKSFLVDFVSMGKTEWRITLRPTDPLLQKVFQSIVLHGDTFLKKVTLIDQQKDATEIQFNQHRTTPLQLTNDEKKQFRME